MSRISWILLIGLGLFLFMSFGIKTKPQFIVDKQTPIWDVLVKLGKIKTNMLDTTQQYSIRKGEELVYFGQTTDFRGRSTPRISKKLVCSACHSTESEYGMAEMYDPQVRLEYCDSLDRPFLPASPLFGMINRRYFFNGDYITLFQTDNQKLKKDAHLDIRSAIQFCNQYIARGRELKEWEVESIIAFLWTLELKIGDLNLSETDLSKVQFAIDNNRSNARAVDIMRRHYPEIYPASLVPPQEMQIRKQTSPVLNDFTNGKKVYQRSCLHCHENKRYSNLKLDMEPSSFKFLKKHLDDTSRHSMYNVIRYSPESKGYKLGMPHYSSERLSDQQLQDLRFFIIQVDRLGAEAFPYYETPRGPDGRPLKIEEEPQDSLR
ncbi:MAG: cytochrome c [Saprospiraceae bacterium]|nr:cytochrome c [Saprospiraceae bacterium]